MGDKFAITLNDSKEAVIVTDDYIVFRIVKRDIILDEYLFMLFNRPEFDRYVRFNSWGSATEMFVWENMQDVVFSIPDIDQQRKFVNVYLSLKENLAVYQSKAEELKTVCDGYLDNLRREYPAKRLENYIEVSDERNSEGQFTLDDLRGISIQKAFIESKADMAGVSLDPYLVVRTKSFAFVTVTSRNSDKITLAFNDSDQSYIVSSSYVVFRVKDGSILLPEYLFMFFNRPEFDRYARFNSWGSAREVFSMEDMNEVSIPIPDVSIQQRIVDIHKCYLERQRIADSLKEQIRAICPILIKGSLQTEN